MKLKFLKIVIFICLTLIITYYFRGANELKAEINKPNIIVILADDLGWNDVGFHGSEIKTPNLDKLAASGVRLERFYVKSVCTPTRAAFLTGRHPFRYGMSTGVIKPWDKVGLPLEEKTIAETLKEAGYYTAILGKWHLGHYQESFLPTSRGFDYHYGHYLGGIDYFTHNDDFLGALDWHRNRIHLKEEGYATDLIGQEAVKLINNHNYEQQPLFLYIAFNAPHTPLHAKTEDIEDYLTIDDEKRRVFAAQVQSMDEAIGKIIQSLENQQVCDNTFVFFVSDNGGSVMRANRGDNRPLRGGKNSLYEGGVRVPAIVSYPPKLSANQEINQIFSIVDLYPTLAKLAGVESVEGKQLDGLDIFAKHSRRDELLIQYRSSTSAAIIKDNYKLVLNGGYGESPYYGTVELFNLKTDPLETHNLAYVEPEKVKEITTLLERYEQEAQPSIIEGSYVEIPEDFIVPEVWSPEYLQR
ncbi:arylsulfatase [Gloeocapsa sp. PCC 73106]|uniref:arylsulfatase B n=1 Tax=Gloeocapsa sp. PCC 73106 TaxID=102232 RepID=UPI0002AC8BAE|nr:arylsulfatase [Gloeocapsa sp. PCC 73106]ELR98093.1 arylsulfatase A family protein [Gloeocapsa sp. PCC 73106]